MSADNNAAGNDADTLHSATDSSSKRMRLAFGFGDVRFRNRMGLAVDRSSSAADPEIRSLIQFACYC